MTQGLFSTRALVRHLINRPGVSGPKNISGLLIASQCVWDELARWIGVDGCHALISRAVSVARSQYPELPLSNGIVHRSRNWLEGIGINAGAPKSGATEPSPDVRAFEEILAALVELLIRMVGEPIAMNLIQPCLSDAAQSARDPRGEETNDD